MQTANSPKSSQQRPPDATISEHMVRSLTLLVHDMELLRPWLLRAVASDRTISSEEGRQKLLKAAAEADLNDLSDGVDSPAAIAMRDGLLTMWSPIATGRAGFTPHASNIDLNQATPLCWFIVGVDVPQAAVHEFIAVMHWGLLYAERAVSICEAMIEHAMWEMDAREDKAPLAPEIRAELARTLKAGFGYPDQGPGSHPVVAVAQAQPKTPALILPKPKVKH